MNFAGLAAAARRRGARGRRRDPRRPRPLLDADRRPGAGLHLQGRRPARHADEPRPGPARPRTCSRTSTRPGSRGLLAENADEPHARRARRRDPPRPRPRRRSTTTRALADVVRAAYAGARPEDEADDAIRRVFQAIRIAVNDEFAALDALLRSLPSCLKPGGRVADPDVPLGRGPPREVGLQGRACTPGSTPRSPTRSSAPRPRSGGPTRARPRPSSGSPSGPDRPEIGRSPRGLDAVAPRHLLGGAGRLRLLRTIRRRSARGPVPPVVRQHVAEQRPLPDGVVEAPVRVRQRVEPAPRHVPLDRLAVLRAAATAMA